MGRDVKHFGLHEVAGIELRVVADVENGVLQVLEAEEAVIRGYVDRGVWQHRWVELLVLQDLQPLAGRLAEAEGLPPGGSVAVDLRPVVNAYDLADLSSCHVFVNQKVMVAEGYWDDPQALRALLAHEHAHPLSENAATHASRGLRLSMPAGVAPRSAAPGAAVLLPLERLVALLAEKLCCYAAREIFANELTIRVGFGDDLFHLDRRVVADAARGVRRRAEVANHLQLEVEAGRLTDQGAGELMLVGDLRGYLDLALEIAPFRRAGLDSQAAELEAVLDEQVFPLLQPGVAQVYHGLCGLYVELRPEMAGDALLAWGRQVLSLLTADLHGDWTPLTIELDDVEDLEREHA